MAISPTCDKCGDELTEFGAIILSPPNAESEVKKLHICSRCYDSLEKWLRIASDDTAEVS